MKRLICLIALLSIVLIGCSTAGKSNTDKAKDEIKINATTKLEKEDIENIKYEKVTYLRIKELKNTDSEGWVWKQKIVNKKEDIKKVVEFLKSIKYTEIDQELRRGFGQIVELKEQNDVRIVFGGDSVNVNGKYFGISNEEDENMKKIYEDLNYNEETSERF
ncbi:MAG: hypothetical protein Q8942_00560 [Bacillota bacterium]|nr:hypothetical protein [Bacillota bacterium]